MVKRITVEIGSQFGTWTVKESLLNEGRRRTCYLCICASGHEQIMDVTYLRKQSYRKCQQCIRTTANKNKQYYERLHAVWVTMRDRCQRAESTSWNQYGGRGIYVCDKWRNDFESFRKWATENGYQPGLQIDRIDNDGPYHPENCRWVTRMANGANKRNNILATAFGETKTISEWSRDIRCRVSYATLRARLLNYEYDPEVAITAVINAKVGA